MLTAQSGLERAIYLESLAVMRRIYTNEYAFDIIILSTSVCLTSASSSLLNFHLITWYLLTCNLTCHCAVCYFCLVPLSTSVYLKHRDMQLLDETSLSAIVSHLVIALGAFSRLHFFAALLPCCFVFVFNCNMWGFAYEKCMILCVKFLIVSILDLILCCCKTSHFTKALSPLTSNSPWRNLRTKIHGKYKNFQQNHRQAKVSIHQMGSHPTTAMFLAVIGTRNIPTVDSVF